MLFLLFRADKAEDRVKLCTAREREKMAFEPQLLKER